MEAMSIVLVVLSAIMALCAFGFGVWVWVTIIKLISKAVKKYLDS